MSPMSPRTLRPGGVFTPRSIPGLVSWWDASASETITLNAGRVSSFANLVAGGPAMTQPTAANQPLYELNAINGRNAIFVDDTSRALLNATAQTIAFAAIAMAPTGTQTYGTIFSFSAKHGIIRDATTNNAYFSAASAFPQSSFRRNGVVAAIIGTTWAVFSQGGTASSLAAKIDADSAGGLRATGLIGEIIMASSYPNASIIAQTERYLGRKWGISVA
jgi:hypothetical protein